MSKNSITFCAVCGARFKEGTGWIDEHKFPCANARYGWFFTLKKNPMKIKLPEEVGLARIKTPAKRVRTPAIRSVKHQQALLRYVITPKQAVAMGYVLP